MNKRKRVSLSTRLQPYSGTLLAEVVNWLNSQERDEMNRLIADAIIMAYLPYARASDENVSTTELERCCWETQNMLDKHGFNLRQSLQISQPQWHSTVMSPAVPRSNSNSRHTVNGSGNYDLESNDEEESIPQSLIEGEGEEDGDLFADDEFD